MKTLFAKRFRPAWAGVLITALLLASLTLPPVRVWAGQFLGLFRVQNIKIVSVDPTLMTQLTGNSPLGQQIGQLLSSSVQEGKQPAAPQLVQNAQEAAAAAGFRVRLPSSRADAPRLQVTDSASFQFTVDRARAQAILDQAGRSDLRLPASLDGTTIKIQIPKGVSAAYGDCPTAESSSGSPGRRFANCIILAEIPSPTIDTPPDLDVEQLAELGLQFTGMTAQQAHDFARTVDWSSTLVVPIPRNAASYKQVTVDGVSGYLIQRPADDAPEYALVWVKNGIIYALGGIGTNTAPALQMADSMK